MININLRLSIDEILKGYFERELNDLIEKYSNIEQEGIERLKQIYKNLQVHEDNNLMLKDVNILLELMKESSYKTIEMYFWMKRYMRINDAEQAKRILEELDSDGYIEYNNYLLAYEDADLGDFYRDIFLELLEDTNYVEEFFTKERLAEMWVERIRSEDAVEELLTRDNPMYELLGVNLEESYSFNDGKVLLIAKMIY